MRHGFWLFFIPFSLFADESVTQERLDAEMQALKEWIQEHKEVSIKSLGGKLSLSGEVRTEMQKTSEVVNNIKQRGAGGAVPGAATYNYDVEVNLLFNYYSECSLAAIKIEFDNKMGDVNGTVNKIALERAFFGVRLFDADAVVGTFEVGRRKLNFTFDSYVEFAAYMDGIMLKIDAAFDYGSALYLHGGPFLIDRENSQYGWVAELGYLNIVNTGLYLKYSVIDWDTKDFSDPLLADYYRFFVGQYLIGYKRVLPRIEQVLTLYFAFLDNYVAKGVPMTGYQKDQYAWYLGFSIGEVRRQGDWSLNMNYQSVDPQAIPSFDVSGIGRGNAADKGFYYNKSKGELVATTQDTAAGDTNYKGVSIDFLYLFTNNLQLELQWQQSIPQNHAVGPNFRYKQFEIELIYFY